MRFGVVALLSVVAVVAAVALSTAAFTGGNTVPPSKVGTTATAITPTTLSPSLCRSNGVTADNLIVSSSSTVNGNSGDDLIITTNTSSNQTLRGNGGKDCLVAGRINSGRTITMTPSFGSGSVCIKGPGPGSYSYGSGCAVKG